MGSYAYMYPLYHGEETMNRWFRHAENVYIETLAELGIIGITLLALALLMIAIYSRRLMQSDSPFNRALGVAGFCCLIGQAIVCIFDFGIYQPPNTALVAIIFGMVTSRSFLTGKMTDKTERVPQKKGSPILILLLIAFVAGSAWALRESHAVECVRQSSRLIRLFNSEKGAHPEYLDQAETMLALSLIHI